MSITNVGKQTVTANHIQGNYYKGAQERGEHIDISEKVDDAVVLDISTEGFKKLDESTLSQDRDLSKVTHSANAYQSIDHLLPEYSGIANVDQAIHDALKNADDDTKAFVYRTIRNNFLMKNASGLSEEERQANISLGMEKATYAANTMIDENHQESFLNAMEQVAKLASGGKREADGTMDYGNTSKTYVGQDGRLVQTTDVQEIMKKTDKKAYEEYKSMQGDTYAQIKYFMKWHSDNLASISKFVNEEEEKKEEILNTTKLDKTFQGAGNSTKEAFMSFLKKFSDKNSSFMSTIVTQERLTWAK